MSIRRQYETHATAAERLSEQAAGTSDPQLAALLVLQGILQTQLCIADQLAGISELVDQLDTNLGGHIAAVAQELEQ